MNRKVIGSKDAGPRVSFHSGFRVPLMHFVCCGSQPSISMYGLQQVGLISMRKAHVTRQIFDVWFITDY